MARAAGKGTHYTVAVLDANGEPTSSTFQLPGVTHILDTTFSKPALVYWNYRQTLAGVAHLLRRYGGKVPADPDSLASLLKAEGKRPTDTRDSAAKGGTYAHAYLERLLNAGKRAKPRLLVEGKDDERTNGVAAWFERFENSLDKILSLESVVLSFKGGFAGTLDLCYQTPEGETILLDLKTGGVYHTSFLQLAAYKLAWEEQGGQAIDKLVVLQCPRNGPASFYVHTVQGPEVAVLEKSWGAALAHYKNIPKGKYKGAQVDEHPAPVLD